MTGESQHRETENEELLGATISGRYKVLSLIARGGMGKVFKAEQSALGRVCALKVLSPHYEGAKDPEFHRRFTLEAETAARLTHPNTVTIYDYGRCEQHGIYYIAMEYLDGRTLHRILREEETLSEARVSRVAQQICRSLHEAHRLGVVHRDLKPSNVLILDRADEPDFVKVLDFGLVKDVTGKVEELTQTGLFMGSPKYMAPEQVLGTGLSPCSDIYSLGVIMYEALCGKVPFDHKAGMSTLVAHVNEMPRPLTERRPDLVVSTDMESIVMRCLAKDPKDRYESMKELLSALKRAGGDLTDSSESLPRPRVDADLLRVSSRGGEAAPRSSTQTSGLSEPHSASGTLLSSGGAPSSAAAESLVPPPQASRAFTRGRPLATSVRPYAVAVVAAVLSGGIAAALVSRRQAVVAVPTATASVAVAMALPASAEPPRAGPGVRIVTVESEPPGAGVSDHGVEVCIRTPCRVYWAGDSANAEHQLTLSKRGYKTTTVDVLPGLDKVVGHLEPPGVGAVVPGPVPDPYSGRWDTRAAAAPDAQVPVAPPPPSDAATTTSAPPPVTPTPAPAPAPAPPPTTTVVYFEEGMTRPSLVSGAQPVYPREAIEAKVSGTVIAKCVITTSGSVTGCRIIKGLPFMDRPVLDALAGWKYTPATRGGTPVAVDYAITLRVVPP